MYSRKPVGTRQLPAQYPWILSLWAALSLLAAISLLGALSLTNVRDSRATLKPRGVLNDHSARLSLEWTAISLVIGVPEFRPLGGQVHLDVASMTEPNDNAEQRGGDEHA